MREKTPRRNGMHRLAYLGQNLGRMASYHRQPQKSLTKGVCTYQQALSHTAPLGTHGKYQGQSRKPEIASLSDTHMQYMQEQRLVAATKEQIPSHPTPPPIYNHTFLWIEQKPSTAERRAVKSSGHRKNPLLGNGRRKNSYFWVSGRKQTCLQDLIPITLDSF